MSWSALTMRSGVRTLNALDTLVLMEMSVYDSGRDYRWDAHYTLRAEELGDGHSASGGLCLQPYGWISAYAEHTRSGTYQGDSYVNDSLQRVGAGSFASRIM